MNGLLKEAAVMATGVTLTVAGVLAGLALAVFGLLGAIKAFTYAYATFGILGGGVVLAAILWVLSLCVFLISAMG